MYLFVFNFRNSCFCFCNGKKLVGLCFFRDGKSRQFGFVGFRSEKESEEALKFFNNSFMDTCRITCEVCDLPFLLPVIVTKTLAAALVI